ncbi:MAG: hypothetical protein J6S14_12755 [Clostridia bacterium]|nr:hypothetical protein [Clostridia bacterium]
MAETKKPIQGVSEDTKNKILRVSARNLPDNPSARGMKPDEIREAFVAPIIGQDSLMKELDRVVEEANEAIGSGNLPAIPDSFRKYAEEAYAAGKTGLNRVVDVAMRALDESYDEALNAAEAAKTAKDEAIEAVENASDSAIAGVEAVKNAAENAINEVKQAVLDEFEIAGTVVQTTGESKTAVMSQNAVSNLVRIESRSVDIPLTMVDGKFALAGDGVSSGTEGSTSGVQRSDFIPVVSGEKYVVSTWAGVNVPAVVFFLDTAKFSTGQFKGALPQPYVTSETYIENLEFTVPDKVQYMVINARKSVSAFTPTLKRVDYNFIENIPDEIDQRVNLAKKALVEEIVVQATGTGESVAMSQKAVSDLVYACDVENVSFMVTDGKFALAGDGGSSGIEGSTSGTQRSGFISVTPGETYRVTTWVGVNVPAVVFFWDTAKFSTGQFKGALPFPYVTGETFVENMEFTIPENVAYMVINARRSASSFTPTLQKVHSGYLENIPDEINRRIKAATDDLKQRLSLAGRTIVTFGDSIFGNVSGETGVSANIATETGATVINCSFGGTRMTQGNRGGSNDGYNSFDFPSLVDSILKEDFSVQDTARNGGGLPAHYKGNLEALKTVDWDKVDVVTMNYGTNDYTSNVSLETLKEEAVFNIGALMNKFPHITFILITPAWRFWYKSDGSYDEDSTSRLYNGNNLVAFCNKSKDIANLLNIPCVDVYNIGIGRFNYSYYFNETDGTHHDTNGRKRLADYISRQLVTII